MRRALSLATLVLCLALIHMARAQNSQKPKRPNPENGTELIAWTQLQEPRPMPSADGLTVPGRQTDGITSLVGTTNDFSIQPVQSFSGAVISADGEYLLKVADGINYYLDDQELGKKFEGKDVQVTGNLVPGSDLIKVQEIKAAS
jgi:Protein of unknown function (DUF5818)